jgi:hypothetical protein
MSIAWPSPASPAANTEVSIPLEKALPSPVTTTARTAGSAPARAPASRRAWNTSRSIAFRTSGRSIVIVATASVTS